MRMATNLLIPSAEASCQLPSIFGIGRLGFYMLIGITISMSYNIIYQFYSKKKD